MVSAPSSQLAAEHLQYLEAPGVCAWSSSTNELTSPCTDLYGSTALYAGTFLMSPASFSWAVGIKVDVGQLHVHVRLHALVG